MKLQPAFADGGGAQQVFDETLEPQRAAVHGSEHALDLLGIEMQEVFGEQLRRGRQRGQWAAQLMGDGCEDRQLMMRRGLRRFVRCSRALRRLR